MKVVESFTDSLLGGQKCVIERLAGFFKECPFVPKQQIIKEGNPAESAFLIRSGICTILSLRTPLIESKLHEGIELSLNVNMTPTKSSRNNIMRGYM